MSDKRKNILVLLINIVLPVAKYYVTGILCHIGVADNFPKLLDSETHSQYSLVVLLSSRI